MLQTAEQVAKRYNIGREAHGRVRCRQWQRLPQPRQLACSGRIAPITVMGVADKVMGLMTKEVTGKR